MRTITLFTTAKPFAGHPGIIQRNALESWTRLDPRPEILLIGSEDGYDAVAEDFGALRVEALERNEFGTPLVSDIFDAAHRHGTGDVLVFSNADIILPPKFAKAVETAASRFEHFLLVGRRVDLDVNEPIDFAPGWYERIETKLVVDGAERGDLAIDYFAFSRALFQSLPPFAIGRTRYDNWLIWKAADEGAVVVDATPFVRVIHQNHDYGHVGGSLRAWEGPEARRADQLLGHWSHYHSIAHARLMLTENGAVAPARGLRYTSARSRRVASHALRATRPLRRRTKILVSTMSRPKASTP